ALGIADKLANRRLDDLHTAAAIDQLRFLCINSSPAFIGGIHHYRQIGNDAARVIDHVLRSRSWHQRKVSIAGFEFWIWRSLGFERRRRTKHRAAVRIPISVGVVV